MGFPPGMVLNTIAFGIPLTATGKDVVTKVSVKPTSRVIWAATGQPLPEFTDSFTAEPGQLGQFQIPAVDQPGFIDSAGNAVTDFAYQITASWEYGNERPIPWAKNLKPLQGQAGSPIDLDLVPDGPVSIPVTAPTAAVLGFGGRTGFITLQESDLPGRLSAESLSATYLDKLSGATKAEVASGYTPLNVKVLDDSSQFDANGDSFLAQDIEATPGRRYISALTNKYGPILYNRAAGGSWMIDAAVRAIGSENTMPRRFDNHTVFISAGINESINSTNTAGVHAGYRRALESLLWLAAAESRIEESAWTYSGVWTDQSVALASPNAQWFSGSAAKATTDDAGFATIAVTGTDYVAINYTFPTTISTANRGTWFVNDVQVAASYADAGTPTTQGRFFHPAPTPLLKLGAGTKTIKVVAPVVGYTYVDTLLKLATAPPTIVIVKPSYTNPAGLYPVANATVDAYRADIDTVVAEVRSKYPPLAGGRIIVIDPVAEGFNAVTMTGTDGLHLNNAGHDFYTGLIERTMSQQTGTRRQVIDGILASLLADTNSATYKILHP